MPAQHVAQRSTQQSPAHLLCSQQPFLLLHPLLHLSVGSRKLLLLLLPALQRRAGGGDWGWGWLRRWWLHLLLRWGCWLLRLLRLERHHWRGTLPRHRRGRRHRLHRRGGSGAQPSAMVVHRGIHARAGSRVASPIPISHLRGWQRLPLGWRCKVGPSLRRSQLRPPRLPQLRLLTLHLLLPLQPLVLLLL